MIKAISKSAVLDQISFAIIKEASKGNYAAWIVLPTTNVDKYYLKELGISLLYKGGVWEYE